MQTKLSESTPTLRQSDESQKAPVRWHTQNGGEEQDGSGQGPLRGGEPDRAEDGDGHRREHVGQRDDRSGHDATWHFPGFLRWMDPGVHPPNRLEKVGGGGKVEGGGKVLARPPPLGGGSIGVGQGVQ